MFSPETEELTFLSGSKYFFKWLDLITMIMMSLESPEIFLSAISSFKFITVHGWK